ncbi:hypothetical protein N7519_003525 [Penicillium mononematosum]|uniref:uncharacterized protein n=1 Tax=Penicillium mononematosum TaxID=268346 RepID=UPI0025482B3B|nr:uncharacterized protein N7519_003525 [Penicillium mononematosum]KAJ6188617.1 hypothetical protein N7519_003525 [Penicillium mononematosum]
MNVETANVGPGVPEDRILQIHNEKAKAPEVWPTSMWGLAANEQPQAAERTKDATTSAALQSLDQIAGFGGDPEKPKMTGYFYFLDSEGEIRGSPQNAENAYIPLCFTLRLLESALLIYL